MNSDPSEYHGFGEHGGEVFDAREQRLSAGIAPRNGHRDRHGGKIDSKPGVGRAECGGQRSMPYRLLHKVCRLAVMLAMRSQF